MDRVVRLDTALRSSRRSSHRPKTAPIPIPVLILVVRYKWIVGARKPARNVKVVLSVIEEARDEVYVYCHLWF